MPLGITLLIALAITIGVCVLLFCGPYLVALVLVRVNKNFGIKDLDDHVPMGHPAIPFAIFGFIFLLVLGVMIAPPQWRVWAALSAASVVIGFYVTWIVWMNMHFRP